jgi:hypothetical protein
MSKSKSLSPEDLEKARQRVLSAKPYSDEVRREFILQWLRQDNLPKEMRSLVTSSLAPSGWVISHLVPLLCLHFANKLKAKEGEASFAVASLLLQVADIVKVDAPQAIKLLMEKVSAGTGSKLATDYQSDVLRVLDLGIIGLPFVASIYAKSLGVVDTSTTLISETTLTIEQCAEAGKKLDGEFSGTLSEGDKLFGNHYWLPKELLLESDLNTIGIKFVPPRD